MSFEPDTAFICTRYTPYDPFYTHAIIVAHPAVELPEFRTALTACFRCPYCFQVLIEETEGG